MTIPAGVSVPRNEALRADLVLVLVTAIWGSTFIVNRLALETAPPLVFVLVRFAFAGLVLYALTNGRPRTPNLARDSAVIGVLLAIGIGSQISGQLFTTASKAAFVTGLSVPLTPLAGYLMTRKKPSRENLAGLVLAAAGFAVLTWPQGAAGWNRGDLLILVTAVSYAILIVVMAETAPKHDVRWYSFGQIAAGAVAVGVARLALAPFLSGKRSFRRGRKPPSRVDAADRGRDPLDGARRDGRHVPRADLGATAHARDARGDPLRARARLHRSFRGLLPRRADDGARLVGRRPRPCSASSFRS